MIDLVTKEAKERYHQTLLKIWKRLELIMAKRLKPIIGRQYLTAASLYAHGVKDVNFAVERERKRLIKVYQVHYRRVFRVAGKQVIDAINEADLQTKQEEESLGAFFERSMQSFIATNVSKQVTKINNTTRKGIQAAIDKGLEEGESALLIAKRIRRVKGITTNFRSRVIARTETHSAYTFATDQAVKSRGRRFERAWQTTRDERTRSAHRIAHGQKKEMDQPFDVGGEHLMYPGDPKGSAKNIIHCRCALLYESLRRR